MSFCTNYPIYFIFYYTTRFYLENQRIIVYKVVKSFFEFYLVLLSLILANVIVLFNTIKNKSKYQLINLIKISFTVLFIIFIIYLPLCYFTNFSSENYKCFSNSHTILNIIYFYLIFITIIISLCFFGVLIFACYEIMTKNQPIILQQTMSINQDNKNKDNNT